MYAVVEDRNQQYRVQSGDRVFIALKSDAPVGSTFQFDHVCLWSSATPGEGAAAEGGAGGGDSKIGTPYVDGVSVTAKVIRQDVKGPKLIVAKYRRRKNSRKRTGFRARYTEVQIESIDG